MFIIFYMYSLFSTSKYYTLISSNCTWLSTRYVNLNETLVISPAATGKCLAFRMDMS